jgi:RNA polymerase sigma-70 factor (sigma-E family)
MRNSASRNLACPRGVVVNEVGLEGALRVSDAEQFAGLEVFLADRGAALLRTAVLLTGSREAGEDLLQLALERALRRWQRVDGDPEPYLRQTLYHLAVDRWRWRTRHPEVDLTADLAPSGRDLAAEVELRDALVQALASLSARQRAVLVLRYFEQLTEAEIAFTLGCSAGAVKSAAARGLQRLRILVASWEAGESGSAADGGHAERIIRRSLTRNGAQA